MDSLYGGSPYLRIPGALWGKLALDPRLLASLGEEG